MTLIFTKYLSFVSIVYRSTPLKFCLLSLAQTSHRFQLPTQSTWWTPKPFLITPHFSMYSFIRPTPILSLLSSPMQTRVQRIWLTLSTQALVPILLRGFHRYCLGGLSSLQTLLGKPWALLISYSDSHQFTQHSIHTCIHIPSPN